MIVALLYLLSTLIAPAPLVSMTIETHAIADQLTVVTHLLSSDPRYTDYAITVAGVTTPVYAPLSELSAITTTLPLDLPPICNAHVAYAFVVSVRVLTDTLPFARTSIGGLATRPCPLRLYIP